MKAAVQIQARGSQQRFVIDESSKVGEARRAAQTLAGHELDATMAGRVSIAATELANNLLLHAGGGELLIQLLGADETAVVELLAIDKGRGMSDVARCMADGYSTAGTPGTGLGAIRRLASEFDIHSVPLEGTIVMARFGAAMTTRIGAINLALEGEVHCGDGWSLQSDVESTSLFMIDGLGHGTFAYEAAQTAIGSFLTNPFAQPQEILMRANGALAKTRGGAGACARIVGDKVSYAGVGNISAALVSPDKSQGLVSHNGTLGLNQRRAQQFEYTREPGALLVMHSDGVSARWDIRNRTDLLTRHPAIVAAAIYRGHVRKNDDATVVVLG